MEQTRAFITQLDLIGVPVKLKFRGSSTVKTAWGGLLSILLIALMGTIVFSMGRDLFTRDSPLVRQSSRIEAEVSTNIRDFPLMMYFADEKGTDISLDPDFSNGIQFFAELFYAKKGQNTVVEPEIYTMGFKQCEPKDLYDFAEVLLEETNHIESAWCIDTSVILNAQTGQPGQPEVKIKNEFGTMESYYIAFHALKCDEKANPGCADGLSKFQKIYMGLAFIDSYQDVSSFENPIKRKVAYNARLIAQNFSLTNYVSFTKNDLITDGDLFLSLTESETFITKGAERLSFDLYNPATRFLSSIVMDMSQLYSTTFRKYPKVTDLLASIGGLVKAGFVIAQLFAYTYSEFTLLEGLNSHLSASKAASPNPVERIELRREDQNKEVSVVDQERVGQNRSTNGLNNISGQQEGFSFSFFNYLMVLVGRKKKKLFLERKQELENYTDLLFIAKNLADKGKT